MWNTCLEKVRAIRDLPDDWDDAGSKAIELEVVEKSERLLNAFMVSGVKPPEAITPSPDGSIIFGWLSETGLVELEIGSLTDPLHLMN